MSDQWVPVRGYESRYLINEKGQVRSLRSRMSNLIGEAETPNMRTVLLTGDCGERRRIGLHELIAEAFHGPKRYGSVVLARDGNLKNCVPENIFYDDENEEVA